MHTDILIVGGGLSGLSLADHLQSRARDFHLIEARNRFGGRIKTETNQGYFDLGPAWYWPGQPRLAAAIDRFGLNPFEQYHQGALSFEDARGTVERGRGFASMQGSFRLEGGMQALIDAFANALPAARIARNAAVTSLHRNKDHVLATLNNGAQIKAQQVVLALPPRVAVEMIVFTTPLPRDTKDALRSVPTWMAGQAKAVAVYDTPFWREAGLSGDASSQRGPMVEIHDASPVTGGPYALFGFIGVPPQARQNLPALKEAITAQLARLFGPQACSPVALYLKDWASDTYTATDLDLAPLYAHPQYGMPSALSGLWDNRLHFSGTETAPQFGGYLEGALEAAEVTFGTISNGPHTPKLRF